MYVIINVVSRARNVANFREHPGERAENSDSEMCKGLG